MNFLTYKLVSFVLLASSFATSAYCMQISEKIKVRQEISKVATEQINRFVLSLLSEISQKSELPNILLWGTPDGINKTTVARNLAQKCGLTCQCISVADLCKDDPNTAAKKLAELFKSAKAGTKKVMLIVEGANAFKESSSITNQFLALTGTPSSKYMLAFTIDNYTDLPKAVASRVDTKVYIDTVLGVDDGTHPAEIYKNTSPESELNLDNTAKDQTECSLQ